MQKKILKALFTALEAKSLEVTHVPEWANTGKVYVTKPGVFQNVLALVYDFQDSWGDATIQFYKDNPVMTCGFTHERCLYAAHFSYSDHAEIEAMLAWVNQFPLNT